MEDNFSAGRPDFNMVDGVSVTQNVEPYELMKLRLLNSSHSVLAYTALLLNHTYVHEAVCDETIRNYLKAHMKAMKSTLEVIEGIDFDHYIEVLLDRFSNPAIADTLERLALDGSQKFESTLAPAVAELLRRYKDLKDKISEEAAGISQNRGHFEQFVQTTKKLHNLAFSLACYCRYCAGNFRDAQLDEKLKVHDPIAVKLQYRAVDVLNAQIAFDNTSELYNRNFDDIRDEVHVGIQKFLALFLGDAAQSEFFTSLVKDAFARICGPSGRLNEFMFRAQLQEASVEHIF